MGLYAGYNYFALVHHLQHHRGKDLAGVAYLRRLERLHDLHHHRQVVNFGISTKIWDRLFGTFEPTNEPATDYFFWSTIRSYWMKLTCQARRAENRTPSSSTRGVRRRSGAKTGRS